MLRYHSPRRGAAGGGDGGFTILEMMVTVAILGMIITSFSAVILQCNRMVTKAQRIIRANSKIAAISQVLRKDIQRISKGGTLKIVQGASPAMLLTTGEPMTTTKSATDCLGSYVVWGLKPNVADPRFSVLWRPEYGFTRGRGTEDTIASSLAKVQAYSHEVAKTKASAVMSKKTVNLYYPPDGLSQIGGLWQILMGGCSELEIKWTDGTVFDDTGTLKWYSTAATWTSDDVGEWPKAIMVRFRLTDPLMPEEMSGRIYEIVCELPP